MLFEEGKTGALHELLYEDDLVLMAETMKGLGVQFNCWKTAFEGKSLWVNMGTANQRL